MSATSKATCRSCGKVFTYDHTWNCSDPNWWGCSLGNRVVGFTTYCSVGECSDCHQDRLAEEAHERDLAAKRVRP